MPARETSAAERPMWAFTDKGKVLPCPKGLPEGAILSCREGDARWSRAEPGRAVAARARGAAEGPTLYDETGGR